MKSLKRIDRPGPKRWLGIGIRLLATLFFLLLVVALNRCSLPTVSEVPSSSSTSTLEAGSARLHVQIQPAGARVLIDGQLIGPTSLSVALSAGVHEIRVELEGYEPLVQNVDLLHRQETFIRGELQPTQSATPPAITPTAMSGEDDSRPMPNLTLRHAKIELESGGSCTYTSTQLGVRLTVENSGNADAGPFVIDVYGTPQFVESGLPAGQTLSIWIADAHGGGGSAIIVDATQQVEESDESDNTFDQMLPIPTLPIPCTAPADTAPSDTPMPSPTIAPVSQLPTGTPVPLSTGTAVPQQPTAIPEPLPSATQVAQPTLPAAVIVRETQVTIPTYPYAAAVREGWSKSFHMPYGTLDREAYKASNPVPVDVTYGALILENEYLKLTFLPDLGGRLYEVFFKPTGHRVTYRNPVLKPSPWGPQEMGWWLAAGGIEWCLPVEEHGYEWGIPWSARVAKDARGATVFLRDSSAEDRVRAEIAVRLEAGAGYFSIRPRLENPTGSPVAVKYWTNAMLAPGGRNAPSADLRFVLPDAATAVTVHSRGDEFLPNYNERMSWPIFNGTDLSRLGNWNAWLGFFEDPAVGGFIAVYDAAFDEGVVRVFDPSVAPGAKGFGFGWNQPIAPGNWTDDNSSYVEVHGGPAATFDDSVILPAGGQLEWTEVWYPVTGLGGLRYANRLAALNLASGGGQIQAIVAVARPWSGDAVLLYNGQERMRQSLSLVPGQSYHGTLTLGEDPAAGRLTLRLEVAGGDVVAEYSADYKAK